MPPTCMLRSTMRTLSLVALCVLFSLPLAGEDLRLWKWSAAAYASSQVFDSATSWGYVEANPRLRSEDGRFGGKAVAIKSVYTGGLIMLQWYLVKKHPLSKSVKVFASINFGLAGAGAAVGIRNLRME